MITAGLKGRRAGRQRGLLAATLRGAKQVVAVEVAQRRKETAIRLGATDVICWMHLPGIAGEEAMRSVELFAREVIPGFAAGT